MILVLVLCLVFCCHVEADIAAAPTNAGTTLGEAPDQLVLACTRNYPSVVGCPLDFNEFRGYGCLTGDSCIETPIFQQPISLIEPGQFTSTWIFVHGNQIPPGEAIKRGMAVYQRVRACSTNNGPIRFVIWSWPSERTTNRLTDAKRKEHRTNVESFYLGSYLAAIAGDSPLRLIGYSFGARVVGGGLHLASGGTLEGHCLPHHAQPVAPHRVVMLAAAIANDGFTNRGRYCHGLNLAEHMLLMNNHRDQALRFYWILDASKPKALGFTGASCRPPHVTIHQYDWAEHIGKDHSLWQYLDRPIIVKRMAEALDG